MENCKPIIENNTLNRSIFYMKNNKRNTHAHTRQLTAPRCVQVFEMWNYEIIVKFNLLRLIFVCNLKREREFSLAHSFFVYLFRCKHSKRKIQRKNIFTSKSKHNGGSLIRWEGFCCCSLNLKPLKRCNYTWKFMLPLSILCIIHWLFYDCQNILFMESTSLKLNYWNRFVFLFLSF